MRQNTGMHSIEAADPWAEQSPQIGTAAEAAKQCLKDTGAIKRCCRCPDAYLMVNDEYAEQKAYDRAEHLWKSGLRGFRGMTLDQVAQTIRSALRGAPSSCPTCH
jgi:hypothetical protein